MLLDTGYQSDGNLLTKTRNQQQNSKKARNKWPNKKGRRDDDPKPAYCDESMSSLTLWPHIECGLIWVSW